MTNQKEFIRRQQPTNATLTLISAFAVVLILLLPMSASAQGGQFKVGVLPFADNTGSNSGDVAGDEYASLAFGFDAFFGRIRICVLVEVCNSDVGAFPREEARLGAANPPARSRDDGHLAVEKTHDFLQHCPSSGGSEYRPGRM